jgi:hypothetical protein
MSHQVIPRVSMERALMALLVRDFVYEGEPLSAHDERVGSDFPDSTDPWYIRIDRVPGGRTGPLEGYDVIDLEVFSTNYLLAESVAFALEALVLGYPWVVEVDDRKVIIDSVTQNVGVADFPWEDDSVYRLGATYVLAARRR